MPGLKKKVKGCVVEAHPDELALKVSYNVVTMDGDDEVDRASGSQTIRLKALGPETNVGALAEDCVKKCKYISSSKLSSVERAIKVLVARAIAIEEEGGEASMDDMDDYMEMLYGGEGGEMKEKVKGCRMILKLCRDVGNLTLLVNHPAMGAVSRLLSDEYRKSIDLCYNCLRIFLSFSNFAEMHSAISTYRVGALTMKVIDFEQSRYLQRRIDEARAALDGEDAEELAVRLKNEKVRIKQEKLLFVCFHVLMALAEDVLIERKMVKKGLIEALDAQLDTSFSANLLILVVMFLKKTSVYEENKNKMRDLGTVKKLTYMVPCSSPVLTQLALKLLFNLSFDKDLRDQMVKASLIPKCVNLLKEAQYRGITLRLLYHLSTDDKCKSMFSYTDAVPIVMQLVIKFPQQKLAKELAALAINLSLNARNAERMTENRGLLQLMNRVQHTQDPLVMKLVRNISQWTYHEQGSGLEYQQRGMWSRHTEQLLTTLVDTDNHELLVEVLGTLANFTPLDLPRATTWAKWMTEFNLTSFLAKLLVPGMAQHDVVLEAVLLIGAMAQDPAAAPLIASSPIVRSLHDVWRDKNEDREVVLQLCHTFHALMVHRETREELLYNTRAVNSLLDCLESPHPGLRFEADRCLDLVVEEDRTEDGVLGELGAQVRKRRFAVMNKEWLAATGHGAGGFDDADAGLDESWGAGSGGSSPDGPGAGGRDWS